MQDFNTMQQLFATNMQGIMTKQQAGQGVQGGQGGILPTSPPDFNTMQHLFATGALNQMNNNQTGSTTQQFQTTTVTQSIGQTVPTGQQASGSAEDFNTMQYLFSTGNVQGMHQTALNQQSQSPQVPQMSQVPQNVNI